MAIVKAKFILNLLAFFREVAGGRRNGVCGQKRVTQWPPVNKKEQWNCARETGGRMGVLKKHPVPPMIVPAGTHT